jgi:FtsP/CotA-like multicopper oxidase with cupredoxin domain
MLTYLQWVYFIIQDVAALDAFHPLHLHGHDYYILAQGRGLFVKGVTPLNLKNPPRRDTAILPGNGYLVIAFFTDNPG